METLNDIEITERLIEVDKNRFDYFIPNYLIKRFKPRSKICSVGCGMAYDVERLNELGFDAYGFDPGNRTKVWSVYRSIPMKKKLRIAATGDQILKEFGDSFDYLYALEVIEHVATEDGGWKLNKNYLNERAAFMEGCLDMLKRSGKLLITTSNRLCPVDIAHGHHYNFITDWLAKKPKLRLALPFHSKNFVCSFSDISKYLDLTKYKGKYSIQSVSTVNYISFSKHKKGKVILSLFKLYMKIVNISFLRTSFLNPLLVVEITKL